MTTRIAVTILLIGLLGCTGENQASDREKHWSNLVEVFFESKRNLDELHAWLREKERYYTFDKTEVIDGNWNVVLETVRVNTLVCEFWVISLDISIDQEGFIQEHSISKQGHCL